jgi:hypothetical protein
MQNIKVTIVGNKKSGFVLNLKNTVDGFNWDQSLLENELIAIREAINKKLK